jgi:hypothetical protein
MNTEEYTKDKLKWFSPCVNSVYNKPRVIKIKSSDEGLKFYNYKYDKPKFYNTQEGFKPINNLVIESTKKILNSQLDEMNIAQLKEKNPYEYVKGYLSTETPDDNYFNEEYLDEYIPSKVPPSSFMDYLQKSILPIDISDQKINTEYDGILPQNVIDRSNQINKLSAQPIPITPPYVKTMINQADAERYQEAYNKAEAKKFTARARAKTKREQRLKFAKHLDDFGFHHPEDPRSIQYRDSKE